VHYGQNPAANLSQTLVLASCTQYRSRYTDHSYRELPVATI